MYSEPVTKEASLDSRKAATAATSAGVPKRGLRMDSFVAILQGVGVAALPAFAAAQESRLVRISEALDAPGMPIWLLTHPDVRDNARVRALLQKLVGASPCCERSLQALLAPGARASKRTRSPRAAVPGASG